MIITTVKDKALKANTFNFGQVYKNYLNLSSYSEIEIIKSLNFNILFLAIKDL